MDRISSSTFFANLGKAESILREHGKLPGGYKPPFLLDYLGRSARSSELERTGTPSPSVIGADKVPTDAPEGVRVVLSRDAVQISVGPELVKSLKSADLRQVFDNLYSSPQVQSILKNIATSG